MKLKPFNQNHKTEKSSTFKKSLYAIGTLVSVGQLRPNFKEHSRDTNLYNKEEHYKSMKNFNKRNYNIESVSSTYENILKVLRETLVPSFTILTTLI